MRLPYAPFADVCGANMSEVARRCGVHPSLVVRWKQRGLTVEMADRCACRFGWHPASVWGDDWWDAARISDEEVAVAEARVAMRERRILVRQYEQVERAREPVG